MHLVIPVSENLDIIVSAHLVGNVTDQFSVEFPLILQKIFVKGRPNTQVYQRLQTSRPMTKHLLWFRC